MLQQMTMDGLDRAVRTLPVIHQQHWIKAALGLRRLKSALPQLADTDWARVLERSQWDKQPTLSSPLSTQVHDPEERSESRVLRQLRRGLFPSVYASGLPWIRSVGFSHALLVFRDEVSDNPGYLGHALSVLLGFREAQTLVEDKIDELLLHERFLEFAASSLFNKISLELPGKKEIPSFDKLFSACLTRPTFFGHHLIALAYLVRNQSWFTETHYARALSSLWELSQLSFADTEDNIVLTFDTKERMDFFQELQRLLIDGPRDVHSITLADSLLELYQRTRDDRLASVARYFSRN